MVTFPAGSAFGYHSGLFSKSILYRVKSAGLSESYLDPPLSSFDFLEALFLKVKDGSEECYVQASSFTYTLFYKLLHS